MKRGRDSYEFATNYSVRRIMRAELVQFRVRLVANIRRNQVVDSANYEQAFHV